MLKKKKESLPPNFQFTNDSNSSPKEQVKHLLTALNVVPQELTGKKKHIIVK